MLTKQNIKRHRPLHLFNVSAGRGTLVPLSLHPSRAKPHCLCPSPATVMPQQQSQTAACVGWNCLRQLYFYKLLLPRTWSKGEAAVVDLGVGRVKTAVLGLLQHPAGLPASHSILLSILVPEATQLPPDARKGKHRRLRGNCSCLCSIWILQPPIIEMDFQC